VPTIKQQLVARKISENNGNLGKTMREVGYAETTANNPHLLTESKGWQELMEEQLPDKLLAEKHRELLEATDDNGKIDVNAVRSGIDMGYKLKGKYAPEKTVHLNIDVITTDDLLLAQELERRRQIQTTSTESDGSTSNTLGGEVSN